MEDMDINIYFEEMAKSVWDKAFFMDKIIGARCVIDFGCADGAMIRFLARIFPDVTFIGYDRKKEFVDKARSIEPLYNNVVFFDSLLYVKQYCDIHRFRGENLCINFSSVLHEVYSFSYDIFGKPAINSLIEYLEPKYITIRDMYCDDPVPFTARDNIAGITNTLTHAASNEKAFTDFIHKFGPISNYSDVAHYLMKIQWYGNGWEQELKENYFSWNIYDFIHDIGDKYNIMFECRYQLPYLTELWTRNLGWYNPDVHTHAQFILRREE